YVASENEIGRLRAAVSMNNCHGRNGDGGWAFLEKGNGKNSCCSLKKEEIYPPLKRMRTRWGCWWVRDWG
ncbi:hypothetical protein A4A49_56781, partial [Nicotiana attenuata]